MARSFVRPPNVVVSAVLVTAVLATAPGEARAQVGDLSTLSLEELINIEVTTASRKEQSLLRTAASVFVLTEEDIRRSGARTIPDLLRQVPGMSVAQIDAGAWAVTARGFNSLYANNLLVLVDGRSVYAPLFAGVYWDMQNLPIGDIERIEIVRGPGGSLWGTNAVSGVINIITRPAGATQGGVVQAGLGGAHGPVADVRYGGAMGDTARYRVSGRYAAGGTHRAVRGIADPDDVGVGLIDARVDFDRGVDRIVLRGAAQRGQSDHVRPSVRLEAPWMAYTPATFQFTDGNAGAQWTRSRSSRSESQVQGSWTGYTHDFRAEPGRSPFQEHWQSVEVESRHRQAVGRRQEIVGGLAYRFWSVSVANTPEITFLPAAQRQHLVTAFVQHEIDLGRRVAFVAGLKAEPNLFTGMEWQPNLRLLWSPQPRRSAVWVAASRAIRIPSVADRGVRAPVFAAPGPGGIPVVAVYEGTASADSEVSYAYEGGYRQQVGRLFVEATVFTNQHDTFLGAQAASPRPGVLEGRPALILPQQIGNVRGGDSHGAELAARLTLAPWWRVSGSWTWFVFDPYASSPIPDGAVFANTPEHQVHVQSYVDLPGRGELTFLIGRVGATGASIPAYTSGALRAGWRVGRSFRVAAGVENLWHGGDLEFAESAGFEGTPARTSVVGDLAWRF